MATPPTHGHTRCTPVGTPQDSGDTAGAAILSIISAVLGAVGLICAFKVSWHIGVIAGIIAIVLGVMAHRRGAGKLGLAKTGIALGAVSILLLIGLVIAFAVQLAQVGLL